MKKPVIYTIIITYNRLSMLQKALPSLYKQTYPIKKIIVVDNCSTDSTWQYLNKLLKKYDNLQLIKNIGNFGMASGINLALKNIWKEKWDAVWVSDDDNIASPSALKELINHYDENTILNSVLLDHKKQNQLTFPMVDLNDGKIYDNLKKLTKKGLLKVNYLSPFNFTLIPKKIIKKVGFLDEKYFIRGEENDFINRTILNNFKLKTIITSQVFCLNQRNFKEIKLFNLKIKREMIDYVKNYYYVRNLLYLLKNYQKKIFLSDKKNIFYNYCYFYKYPLFIFIPLHLSFSIFLSLIFYKKNKLKIIYSTLLAYYHFFINKRGKYQL